MSLARESVPAAGATPRGLLPLFVLATWMPGVMAWIAPAVPPVVAAMARGVRRGTRTNARRVLGRELTRAEERAFTRGVVGSFYAFVVDVGRVLRSARRGEGRGKAPGGGEVVGIESYNAARARGRGAVLVTAHLGSFEAGLAGLVEVERAVHVVFQRDRTAGFERMRRHLRETLGVREAAIDDGLATWRGLRDALLRNEVVVMQGDRAVPGQQSVAVPFLHGTLRVPTGPVRLARLTGSPIVPVFAVRRAGGGHDVLLDEPIDAGEGAAVDAEDPALRALVRAIEGVVRAHPTQWLMLSAAFEEDRRG